MIFELSLPLTSTELGQVKINLCARLRGSSMVEHVKRLIEIVG